MSLSVQSYFDISDDLMYCPVSDRPLTSAMSLIPCGHNVTEQAALALFGSSCTKEGSCPTCHTKIIAYSRNEQLQQMVHALLQPLSEVKEKDQAYYFWKDNAYIQGQKKAAFVEDHSNSNEFTFRLPNNFLKELRVNFLQNNTLQLTIHLSAASDDVFKEKMLFWESYLTDPWIPKGFPEDVQHTIIDGDRIKKLFTALDQVHGILDPSFSLIYEKVRSLPMTPWTVGLIKPFLCPATYTFLKDPIKLLPCAHTISKLAAEKLYPTKIGVCLICRKGVTGYAAEEHIKSLAQKILLKINNRTLIDLTIRSWTSLSNGPSYPERSFSIECDISPKKWQFTFPPESNFLQTIDFSLDSLSLKITYKETSLHIQGFCNFYKILSGVIIYNPYQIRDIFSCIYSHNQFNITSSMWEQLSQIFLAKLSRTKGV